MLYATDHQPYDRLISFFDQPQLLDPSDSLFAFQSLKGKHLYNDCGHSENLQCHPINRLAAAGATYSHSDSPVFEILYF